MDAERLVNRLLKIEVIHNRAEEREAIQAVRLKLQAAVYSGQAQRIDVAMQEARATAETWERRTSTSSHRRNFTRDKTS